MPPTSAACGECSEVILNDVSVIELHIIICYAFFYNLAVENYSPSPEYIWCMSYTSLDPKDSKVIVAKYYEQSWPYATHITSTGTVYWNSFADVLDFVKSNIEEKAA